MTLSIRQTQAMLFIQRAYARDGFMPTLEDIAKGCGVASKGRAHGVVGQLIALGHLAKDANKTRGLKIVRPIPDDRFEEAAKAACKALQCVASPANIQTAREAIAAALLPEAA